MVPKEMQLKNQPKHINALSIDSRRCRMPHSTPHKKKDVPTALNQSNGFGSTVREKLNKLIQLGRSFYNFTSSSSTKALYIEPFHPLPLLSNSMKGHQPILYDVEVRTH